jgi:anion-transporting  ArsA/GET3 family ATPase
LENRIFRTLMVPTRAYLRAVGLAAQALLRSISKVAGAEMVDDAIAFFQAFSGMEEGFRTRATTVRQLLADPSTAYVLVTSPRPDSVTEAAYFADRLAQTGITPAGLIVNRVHPSFGAADRVTAPEGSSLAALVDNLTQLNVMADAEAATCAALVAELAPSPVARVPLLRNDVHDVAGLGAVADQLFGPAPAPAPAPPAPSPPAADVG